MTARERYVHLGLDQLGKDVLWGKKGPSAFDCSGLCTWLLDKVGGPDLTHKFRAQDLFDHSRSLVKGQTDTPLPGDWTFYGMGPNTIVHVAIWLAGGHVLSADGATSAITDLATARAAGAAVRIHPSIRYRFDQPFIVTHRNVILDNLDLVSR